MRALPVLLLIACCSAPDARSGAQDELSRMLAGRAAGEPTRCVPALQNESLRVLDARTLAYGGGRTVWINRLRSDCPGMRRRDALIVESGGGQYCQGDRIRTLDQFSPIPGPICVLGDFTPYRRRG